MMTPQQLADLRALAKAACDGATRASITGAELSDLVAAAELLRMALRHFDGGAGVEWSAAARHLLGAPVPPTYPRPSWADAPADATVLLKNRRAGGGFAWATEYAPNARFTVAAPGVKVVGELLPDHWDVVGWRGAKADLASPTFDGFERPAWGHFLLREAPHRSGKGATYAWAEKFAHGARWSPAGPGPQPVFRDLDPDCWRVVSQIATHPEAPTVAVPEALAHRIAARVTLNPDPNANYCACCGQDLRALAEFRELVQ